MLTISLQKVSTGLAHTFLPLLEREPSSDVFQELSLLTWTLPKQIIAHILTYWESRRFHRAHRWCFLYWAWAEHCLVLFPLHPYIPTPLLWSKVSKSGAEGLWRICHVEIEGWLWRLTLQVWDSHQSRPLSLRIHLLCKEHSMYYYKDLIDTTPILKELTI